MPGLSAQAAVCGRVRWPAWSYQSTPPQRWASMRFTCMRWAVKPIQMSGKLTKVHLCSAVFKKQMATWNEIPNLKFPWLLLALLRAWCVDLWHMKPFETGSAIKGYANKMYLTMRPKCKSLKISRSSQPAFKNKDGQVHEESREDVHDESLLVCCCSATSSSPAVICPATPGTGRTATTAVIAWWTRSGATPRITWGTDRKSVV